ncbi:TPA: hypothetical protein SIA35_004289 [Aeromonas sobria]|nr:hypothetical protein [Aeromonas sobria]
MKNKNTLKANLVVAAILGCIGFSGAATAAVSQKSIPLQWQGVVPASPSTTGDWKFVDSIDLSKDFVPAIGSITVTNDPSTPGAKLLQLSQVDFAIKANTGTLTASSEVKAYLASQPSITGLTPSNANAAQPTLTMRVGNSDLGVGSSNNVTVGTVASGDQAVYVSVLGEGTLPVNSFQPQNNVNVQAAIIFTADVT